MADFFSHTWFVWWTLAIVVVLRWLHVIAPYNPEDASQLDRDDEESQYLSEFVDSSWRHAPNEMRLP